MRMINDLANCVVGEVVTFPYMGAKDCDVKNRTVLVEKVWVAKTGWVCVNGLDQLRNESRTFSQEGVKRGCALIHALACVGV